MRGPFYDSNQTRALAALAGIQMSRPPPRAQRSTYSAPLMLSPGNNAGLFPKDKSRRAALIRPLLDIARVRPPFLYFNRARRMRVYMYTFIWGCLFLCVRDVCVCFGCTDQSW